MPIMAHHGPSRPARPGRRENLGQHISVQTLHWPRLWRTYRTLDPKTIQAV